MLTGLWFESLYDKLVLSVGGTGFVLSLCVGLYIAGAKSTFKALHENPNYKISEWFEIAPDGISSIMLTGLFRIVGISSLFSALKKPSNET